MRTVDERAQAELNHFIEGFTTCALWSSNDNSDDAGGEPIDANFTPADIDAVSLALIRRDCRAFIVANSDDLDAYVAERAIPPGEDAWECAGHDYWLTRNGHGAGFWDRGLGELGDRLSEAARAAGSMDVSVGSFDPPLLYFEGG
jgi:hypothetical protein